MRKRYNYEEAVQDAVNGAYEAVQDGLREGWYDYMPSEESFCKLAYTRLIKTWNHAIVREGPRAKVDTYVLAKQKYEQLFEEV